MTQKAHRATIFGVETTRVIRMADGSSVMDHTPMLVYLCAGPTSSALPLGFVRVVGTNKTAIPDELLVEEAKLKRPRVCMQCQQRLGSMVHVCTRCASYITCSVKCGRLDHRDRCFEPLEPVASLAPDQVRELSAVIERTHHTCCSSPGCKNSASSFGVASLLMASAARPPKSK